ncbi:enoyl-CoA hydratase/isomerase family protein [Streptomyces tremellae]|uniref:Enoyl-CoA hydratase/isomerase family protein n=1 Tax=Streptomyces tremellae TaxID=1124239 RepID=A0ABP7EF63_9ACTN
MSRPPGARTQGPRTQGTRTAPPARHTAGAPDAVVEAVRAALSEDPPPAGTVDRVHLARLDGTAVVTLAAPASHNALTLGSWKRLEEVFGQLAGDRGLRVVVVRGAGDRAFAAGADITEFPHTRLTAADATEYNESIARALRSVERLPVPVVAAVRGLAVGGGCELAAACDIRIATESSRFGIPVGRLGVILGYTETTALARTIGPAALKYLLFSGDLVDAETALGLGLAQRVVPDAEFEAEVAGFVAGVHRQSAITMRAAKLVTGMHGRPLTAADSELLSRLTVEAYEGDDLKEGVAAFRERRPADFGRTRGPRASGAADAPHTHATVKEN